MSRRTFRILPRANVDLDEHFAYIARDSFDAAVRFFEAFWDDSVKLAAMPGMGAQRGLRRRDLRDVRSWPIKGFENFLIFYRPAHDSIEVLRVLHGARDVDGILERGD